MKKVSFILIAFIAALTLNSCQSNSKNNAESHQEQDTTALSVDELLTEAGSLDGTTVSIEGVCTHICSHGGKKIFLMGTDDTKTIRIESNDAFSQDCVNSLVAVSGKVVEERIDEAYLVNWETQVKNDTQEKHGDDEEAAGCSSEQKVQNETLVNTVEERIANFRKRIAEEKELTGKDYLSFYHVVADSYKIN